MSFRARVKAILGTLVRLAVPAAALGLVGCAQMGPPATPSPYPPIDEAKYTTLYPYYAEICALSELEKKPGFGADIFSGIGGHEVLYLNGVCREKDTDYPVLGLCDPSKEQSAGGGVGLSSNAHYSNAMWVAVKGRDFFFNGGLPAGETLDPNAYRAVQAEAKAQRIYAGVTFHDAVFDDMPPGFTRADFKYEISVSTDYAIAFGRNRYCGRVPMDKVQMSRVVAYLNQLNQPYRDGKIFDWNIFTHNCGHVNHNALTAADLWNEWKMDQFILLAVLDFPVPENEFVNLMRRTNDMPIDDLDAVYDDKMARAMLLDGGRLPTEPGALADFGMIMPHNALYDTDSRIIFYDDPITGRYRRSLSAMLAQPRYFRLEDNLRYFAALYARIDTARKSLAWHLAERRPMSAAETADYSRFYDRYYRYIDAQRQEVRRDLDLLDPPVRNENEQVSSTYAP